MTKNYRECTIEGTRLNESWVRIHECIFFNVTDNNLNLLSLRVIHWSPIVSEQWSFLIEQMIFATSILQSSTMVNNFDWRHSFIYFFIFVSEVNIISEGKKQTKLSEAASFFNGEEDRLQNWEEKHAIGLNYILLSWREKEKSNAANGTQYKI